MAGDDLGDDGFATCDYGYATGCRQVMDRPTTGTKFWMTTVGSSDDGYKSSDDVC